MFRANYVRKVGCHFKIAANESVFAMAGYSVFRHADTEVDFCFMLKITFVA